MPVYQYQGNHYDLPDGLTNEQAISKIKAHLGQSTKSESPSLIQNFGGMAAGLGDLATGLVKMPAGIGAAIGGKISDPSTDINIHRQASQAMMDDAMPSMGQAFGVADNPTYKMMMKPFELMGEGIDYLGNQAGKLTGSSDVAGATKLGLDIATLGVGIPGAKLAGKGLAKVAEAVDPGLRNIKAPTSSKAAEILARQRELENSKQIDVPEGLVKQTPMERVATELGAPEVQLPSVMNSMARDLTSVVTPEVRAAEIAREQKLRDVQKELDLRQVEMERAVLTQRTLERNATLRQQQEAASAVSDSYRQYLATQEKARQLAEEAQVNANSERMSRATQLEIDDTPHNGNADIPRTGNVSGTVPRDAFTRVDENGMPIRADLSMDVQKSESPLQRDFWVEQNENFAKMQDQSLIDPATGQWKPAEQVKSIEQALDSMPDLPWRSERDVAIDLLKGELPTAPSVPRMTPFKGKKKSQAGAIDPEVFKEGYKAVAKHLSALTDKLALDVAWQERIKQSLGGDYQTNSDGSPMVLLHGTDRTFDGDLKTSQQGIHAGFVSSPHVFVGQGREYLNTRKSYDGANIRPVVIKAGNYPFLSWDAGNWTPRRFMSLPEGARIIKEGLMKKGIPEDQFYSLRNYVENQATEKGRNQAFMDVLQRAGIDGFFYRNTAESPTKYKKEMLMGPRYSGVNKSKTLDTLSQVSQDPVSFVTWDANKVKSVYDLPETTQTPSFNSRTRKQGGAINIKDIKEGFDKLKSGLISSFDYINTFKGTFNSKVFDEGVSNLHDPKSRSTIALLSPQEFKRLAAPRADWQLAEHAPEKHKAIREALQSEAGLRDIPYLMTDTIDGVAKVVGHEGRHRMDVFERMGVPLVPVIIRDSSTRWGTEVSMYDNARGFPEKIRPEKRTDRHSDAPFPEVLHKNQPKNKAPFNFKNQGGGLLIDPKEQGKKKAAELAGVKLESSIPKDPNISEAIQAALSEGKDSKGVNALQSGSTSTAYKRASAAIHAYSQVVQNALKRADLAVRENVFPFENAIKRLSKDELVTSFELAKDELFSGRPLDGELLASSGLSPKQLEAIAVGRKMMEDSLRIQNEVRAAKGKSPITAREAYYSSRWQGDFRQAIKDSDGKVVYVLAADSRLGLNKQIEALKKEMPDLVMGDSFTVKSSRGKTDLESAYTAMLDILDVRNEADAALINRIEELKEQAVEAQTRTTLGQEKHFKKKTGVRGFVGDRPGMEPAKEAVAFFEQQVQYAKNAYQWAELQRATDSVKELVSNAELQAQQPNNVRYIRDHWKNTLGFGESKAIAAIEDAFRDSFGISPNMVSRGVGSMKSYFILSKLAVSAGNTVTSLLQTTNVAPNMAMLWGRGYKGNPISSIALGMAAGPVMALGHLAKHKFGVDYTSLMTSLGDKAPFWQEAFKYAEDNGVIARSVIDESPIGTAFSKVGTAGKVLGTTISAPEALTRSIAFSTFAEMLRDSGKFKDNSKLFQMAEEMTNLSMYDYRANEHAMVFSKMGNLGKAVDVLQTYPMSWYNQWVSVAKEAGRGNVAPFVVFTALQGTMAGLMGAPYVEDIYKTYMHLKDFLPAKTWAKMEESEFLSDPKLWALKYFGAPPIYGAMSDKTGIGLTSRLAAPGIGAMAQAPGAPLIDLAKQGIAVGKAVMDPTNSTKVAQAAMQVAPVGLQGLLETSKAMEGHTYNSTPSGNLYMGNSDLADRKGQVVRTPEEENLRKWGFRSQREVFERDVAYNTTKATKVAAEKSRTLPDAFYDAIRRGDVESAKDLNTTYVKLTGKAIGNEQLENQVREEFLTTIQNAKTAAKSLQALKNLKRMDELLKEVNQGK